MSATRIELFEYVEALRASVPSDLHPSSQQVIHWWLIEMRDAAHHEAAAEVARIAKRIGKYIALEQELDRRHLHGFPEAAPL